MLCEWWETRDHDGNVVARNLMGWVEFVFGGHRDAQREFRKELVGGDGYFEWLMEATYDQMADRWNTTAVTLGYTLVLCASFTWAAMSAAS